MVESIKLSNREILESAAALAALSQLKLPAKAAYAVAKATSKIGELEAVVRGVQKTMWEKFGEKGDDGKLKIRSDGTFIVPSNTSAEFLKEHNDLLAETNDISGIRKLRIDELDGTSIEPAALIPLHWFVIDA